MSVYEALAGSYDSLTYDIPYADMLAYVQQILKLHNLQPQTVVDLACGTGSMSLLLAQAGYQVIGVDLSEQMLTVAAGKCMELAQPPLFVRQNMCRLELPQPVELIVCLLDSVNYLTDPADCAQMFRRAAANLQPGGMLIFDINTPYKLQGLDGQVFLDETDDCYCVWRAEFEPEEHICYYGMDLFQKSGDLWRRSFEEHREYAYTPEQLQQYLQQAGFTQIACYGDLTLQAPSQTEERIYFAAVRGE